MGRVNQADGRVVKGKRGQHHSGTVRGSGKLGHEVAEARVGATEISRWQSMKSPIILVTEVGFYPLRRKNHKKQCFSTLTEHENHPGNLKKYKCPKPHQLREPLRMSGNL